MIRKMTRQEYEQEFGKTLNVVSAPQQDQGNFLTGLAKSGLSTVKGTLKIGEKLGGGAVIRGIEKLTGQERQPLPSQSKIFEEEKLKTRGFGEIAGKFVGDVAQF